MPVAALDRVRPHEHGAEPELLDRTSGFFDRVANVVRRDHPGSEQALGIGLAVVVQPVVVGPRDGGGERRVQVVDRLGEQPARGIDDGDVDAFGVHRIELRPTVPASLGGPAEALAPLVERVVGAARPRAQRRVPRHRLAVDDDSEVGDVLLQAAWRERLVDAVDVALPEVRRLHAVHVAVKDLEPVVRHGPPPASGQATGPVTAGMVAQKRALG